MGLKKIFPLCIAIALGILVFVGCKQPSDENSDYLYLLLLQQEQNKPSIVGTWLSSWSEKFEITNSYFKNSYGSSRCYEGNEVHIEYASADSGYIYFKYTRAALPDWTYSESASDVGKWYCVAFKNLRADSVSLSGAAGTKPSTETYEEAVAEFTVDTATLIFIPNVLENEKYAV